VFENVIEQDSAKNSNKIFKETKVKRPIEMEILGTVSTAYNFDMTVGRVQTTGGGITSLIYLVIVDSKNNLSFSQISKETERGYNDETDDDKWNHLDMTVYKSHSDSNCFFVSLNSATSFGGWYKLYFYSRNNQTITYYHFVQTVNIAPKSNNYIIDGELQSGGQ
jgi:hypothetical protein